ncbi:MAG: branched-chain amino acid ABC transporter permease [Erysipelotrichaceae bacterium]
MRLFNKKNLAWLALIVGVYLLISFLMMSNIINAYYQITLITVGINIILAISLNLIIGVTGQFSLGHAGFMCVGAYASAIVLKMMPNLSGLLLGIVVGILISSILALLIAIPTLRLKGDYLAIATLGFAEIIRIVVLNLEITNGAAGLSNIPKVVDWTTLYVFIVISLIVIVNFGRSKMGRACISVREDEIAAEAMGINTTKYKVIAFILGASVASVAGGLYAGYFFVITPDTFGIIKSIDILVMIVFGGLGSFTGSIISAGFLGIVDIFLQSLSGFRMIIYAIMLVLIMIFRPQGLLGTKEFTFSALMSKDRRTKDDPASK